MASSLTISNEALRMARGDINRVSDGDTPETITAKAEVAELLSLAAGGLTDRDRRIFRMRFDQDLTLEQIGAALGITAVAACRALSRAIDRMRVSLRVMGIQETDFVRR